MNREQVIATLHAHESELRHRGVLHAGVFGSVASGDASPGSDVDNLIALQPGAPTGLFE
jgi:predicted nucleotidyltransferase